MPDTYASLPLLRDRPIARGERWIFSAGFNVRPDLAETSRIDTELDDIAAMSRAGARVAVLSHQGSFAKRSALDLEFVARYMAARLGRPVRYVAANTGADAVAQARSLAEGEVALFGNTRHHAGEEANDPQLAKAFAALGDFAAIGGFSKAHRAHASNVGIVRWRPAYLARSVRHALAQLAPWAGEDANRYSVAVLGGLKAEKTQIALPGFSKIYDLVIPGGAVLNNLLKASGARIGSSDLGERPEASLAAAQRVLRHPGRAWLHLPRQVVAAPVTATGYGAPRVVDVARGVDDGEAIVDFILEPGTLAALRRVASDGARLLVAGTPGLTAHGFDAASAPVLAAARSQARGAILLGGDTTAELPFAGNKSAGGGSALQYLCTGALPVCDALAERSQPLMAWHEL